MTLVPDTFEVPLAFAKQGFVIRKLTVADAVLDYAAAMSSIDIIRKTRGGDWPSADLTFEEDVRDLVWHEEEFARRTSFAYTVMSHDERDCLGCVYFYPPGHRGEATKDADVDVSFWVTQAACERGLYPALHEAIREWLADWPFRTVAFSNVETPSASKT